LLKDIVLVPVFALEMALETAEAGRILVILGREPLCRGQKVAVGQNTQKK
jgi:hypothetical protein